MASLVLPTTYSALPTNSVARGKGRVWSLVRFVVTAMLVGFALVALVGMDDEKMPTEQMLEASTAGSTKDGDKVTSQQHSRPESLEQPVTDSAPASPVANTPNEVVTVQHPTADHFASFSDAASAVLATIGLHLGNVEEKTGLDEACGEMVLPCVATVGQCLHDHIASENGRLAAAPEACQCFTKGLTEPIPFPQLPDARLTCSFGCLEAMSDAFQQHLFAVNGDGDASLACPRTFMNMAHQVYGAGGDEFPHLGDADEEEVESVASSRVRRAAMSLMEHINLVRSVECPLKAQYAGEPTVLFDERGSAKAGLGQYRLELGLGADTYTGRIVHLPASDRLAVTPSAADPDSLLTRFRVMSLSPDPCAEGSASQLAVTHAGAARVNAQALTWKARVRPSAEGKTVAQFGMGNVPLAKEVAASRTLKLAVDSWEPPAAFDARDHLEGEAPCRAFDVLDQGSCGSCYAFAAASALSARMCLATDRKWNVVLSPQEMMDCNNGCSGGSAFYVYEDLAGDATTVENFCDPYQELKSACGETCAVGNQFDALEGTTYLVGYESTEAVKEMQKELMFHGPGAVSFDVYEDFFAYDGGIYATTAAEHEQPVGSHAVALVGWGSDNGEDYWLLQNSWGDDWGDGGFFKMKRGTNECGIESYMIVVTPEAPSFCPEAECHFGGVPMRDCSCRCNGGRAGEQCDECLLECRNGGVLDGCECDCPPGTYGPDCSGTATLSATALCASSGKELKAKLRFGGLSKPPTQKSFIGIYPEGETRSLSYSAMEYVCGDTFNGEKSDGLCGTAATVSIAPPSEPGVYDVALTKWKPLNEFDQDGWVGRVSNVFARLHVLTDCSEDALKEAEQSDELFDAWKKGIEERRRAREERQAAMTARLKAAALAKGSAATEAEEEEVQPSMTIAGHIVDAADPLVWAGTQLSVCWRLPDSLNEHPKALILYAGGADSTSYYNGGLEGFGPDYPVADAAAGCVDTRIPTWIPAEQYTIKLKASDSHRILVHSVSFKAATAWIGVGSYRYSTVPPEHEHKDVTITVKWNLSGAPGSVKDTVRILDSRGSVYDWFFTSCSCKGPVGASPVDSGEVDVLMPYSPSRVTGGYSVKFYPDGGDAVADVAYDWVPWGDLGM